MLLSRIRQQHVQESDRVVPVQELQTHRCSWLFTTSQLLCVFKEAEGEEWHLKHVGKSIWHVVLRISMLCVDH